MLLLNFSDMTCTRASSASFADPRTGKWYEVGPNVPCIMPDGAMLVEGPLPFPNERDNEAARAETVEAECSACFDSGYCEWGWNGGVPCALCATGQATTGDED